MPDNAEKPHWSTPVTNKLVLGCAVAPVLFVVWALGGFFISLSSPRRDVYLPVWNVLIPSLLIYLGGCTFRAKLVKWISGCIVLVCIASFCMFRAYFWWTVDRYPVMTQKVNWHDYRPFLEGNKLVKVRIPEEYAMNTAEGFPRLNGAYALYPIYAAMVQEMYPASLFQDYHMYEYVSRDGSDVIYKELLNGERDLIFALAPSKKQTEEATAAGVKYELTPFCMDAFVFFVNADNPVGNLTTEQIRGIYNGKITDWKEVGAPQSTKIIPFQRNEGSGSQTTLQKLMGDTPIMPPLKEDRIGGMGDIINDTANYRNFRAALGFSFRYYSTEMLRNNQIRLLSVDGVAPTVENIRDGSYPLVVTVYMVTARPRPENVRKIVDFMLSPEGQKLVEETGYVPIAPSSPGH